MTVHEQRHAIMQRIRSERYAWAKQIDPKAVEAFERKANNSRKK